MSGQTEEAPVEMPSAAGEVPVPNVASLPGGVPAAEEAGHHVVEEPVNEVQLAPSLDLPVQQGREAHAELKDEYDG